MDQAISRKTHLNTALHRLRTIIITGRIWLLAAAHTGFFAAILWFAFWVRFDFQLSPASVREFWETLPWVLGVKLAVFAATGQFHGWWRFVTFADIVALARACVVCFICLAVGNFFLFGTAAGIPRSIILLDTVFTLVVLGSLRSTWRLFRECLWPAMNASHYRPALLVGTDDEALLLASHLQSYGQTPYRVRGLISTNGAPRNSRLGPMPILGPVEDIARVAAAHGVKDVLVTAGRLPGKSLRELMRTCEADGLELKIIPPLEDRLRGGKHLPVRDIHIEDLLRREPVQLDEVAIGNLLAGRRVLVTGAGGSIGSEICRQVMKFQPQALILLGRGENRIFTIERELRECGLGIADCGIKAGDRSQGAGVRGQEAGNGRQETGDTAPTHLLTYSPTHQPRILPVIADIRDTRRLRQIFAEHRPEVVFHAAAHKHVPLMEANVCEAVKNNILGTRAVADAAHDFRATHFVLISSDKAVRPTSVMGATKQIAESYVQALASAECGLRISDCGLRNQGRSQESGVGGQESGDRGLGSGDTGHTHLLTYSPTHQPPTRFMAVRFGNVLGSAGSVVPIFQEQIRRGGPITLTDPRMQRYFMTIPEASQLVLQAAAMGKGGEIFVLEMGDPVKITDLARDMIHLSGLPEDSIEIIHEGIRPGEKLFEELTFDPDHTLETDHPKVWAAWHPPYDLEDIRYEIDALEAACDEPDDDIRDRLLKLVATPAKESSDPWSTQEIDEELVV